MARTHMVSRLGTELRRLRLKKGVSQRKVETETGVSNPYLSQLERGVATSPAPTKLRSLADYYGTSYLDLLGHAGYLPSGMAENPLSLIASSESQVIGDSPLSANLAGLTDDEEGLVLQYIEFLKSRRITKSSS